MNFGGVILPSLLRALPKGRPQGAAGSLLARHSCNPPVANAFQKGGYPFGQAPLDF